LEDKPKKNIAFSRPKAAGSRKVIRSKDKKAKVNKLKHFYSMTEFESSSLSSDEYSSSEKINNSICENEETDRIHLDIREKKKMIKTKTESKSKENLLKEERLPFSSCSDGLSAFLAHSSESSSSSLDEEDDAVPLSSYDNRHYAVALISNREAHEFTIDVTNTSAISDYSNMTWLFNFIMCSGRFWDHLDEVWDLEDRIDDSLEF